LLVVTHFDGSDVATSTVTFIRREKFLLKTR